MELQTPPCTASTPWGLSGGCSVLGFFFFFLFFKFLNKKESGVRLCSPCHFRAQGSSVPYSRWADREGDTRGDISHDEAAPGWVVTAELVMLGCFSLGFLCRTQGHSPAPAWLRQTKYTTIGGKCGGRPTLECSPRVLGWAVSQERSAGAGDKGG